MATRFPGDREGLFSTSSTRDIAEDPRNGKDRISELPDDIILTFLSPMGMKEAAKASIFSKRWKHLLANWNYLDFSHLIIFPESDPNPVIYDLGQDEKTKYINWVNQVVDLHCGPCIDTFRVELSPFWFDSSDVPHVDKWLRFALSKKVKHLTLNMVGGTRRAALYTIELDTDISFLTSLHLEWVNVTGDILEYIMSRCGLLETLYVENSYTLVRLKIGGLSCKLKQLTVKWCLKLEELEIDATSLIYFEYQGSSPCTNLVFKSAPMLVEAVLGGILLRPCHFSISEQMSHIAAHISKLSINLMVYEIPAGNLPTFCNLKHLCLIVDGLEKIIDFIAITHLLKACPLLHEFELEVSWGECYDPSQARFEAEALKEMEEVNPKDVNENVVVRYDHEMLQLQYIELWQRVRQTHPNLKVLRIVGFNGCDEDVDFILLFVGFACNLETITFDTTRSTEDFTVKKHIEVAKSRATKLARLIPPKISVVIKCMHRYWWSRLLSFCN